MPNSILVVDDSKLQRDQAVALCRKLAPQAEIRQGIHGADAVRQLREEPADIVVMDLEMPVMDGIALASHIAAESLARGIVICSSRDPLLIASVGRMSETSGLRVLGMLQKPMHLESLRQSFDKLNVNKEIRSGMKHDFPDIAESEFLAAVENDAIKLFFQPKVTARGILLKGVEALARWKHAEYGFVPPPIFIAMAEKLDIIDQLTFQLLEQAIRFTQAAAKHGLNLSVSVNLSPQSVGKIDFVERVESIVNASGVAPRKIIFEVTENMLLRDLPTTLRSLAQLRLHGFGLSIDDYGTGFANAEQLALLPVTELKIDRSLVNGASEKWQQSKILESTIELGKNLNLVTVAEGVEDVEDYKLLLRCDVDMIQGFYFGKPMPAEQLNSWISHDLRDIRNNLRR